MSKTMNEDANNFIKKAEKCLKTSFLKWNPDYDGALSNYISAAQSYKSAGEINEAIKIYIKISQLHEQNGSVFKSARTEEEIAQLYKQQKNYEKMTEVLLSAANKYRINGTPNSACQLMQKTAKTLEEERPDIAGMFYKVAAEAALDTDNLREAGEYRGLAARMYTRAKDFGEASVCLTEKMKHLSEAGVGHEASKALICLVLLKLYENDTVGATKLYDQNVIVAAGQLDENPLCQLLGAFNANDGEKIRNILKSGTFLYLENDYAKLARDLANMQKVTEVSATKVNTNGDDGGCGDAQVVKEDEDDIN